MENSSSKSERVPKSKRVPNLEERTEFHRFFLAAILVVGFMFVLIVAMAGGYAEPSALASIFSGWIVAIIGFYFLGQASDRVQQQATIITDKTRKMTDLITQTDDGTYDSLNKKMEAKLDDLEGQINKYRTLIDKYKKMAISSASRINEPSE